MRVHWAQTPRWEKIPQRMLHRITALVPNLDGTSPNTAENIADLPTAPVGKDRASMRNRLPTTSNVVDSAYSSIRCPRSQPTCT
jgi:hypothetical protein